MSVQTPVHPAAESTFSQRTRKATSFKGDVLRLVSGTAFAQLLTILVSPILTRYYTPESFGLAALFTSTTALFSVAACFRYEMAIVLPKDDRDGASLLAVSVCISFIYAALIGSLLYLTLWLFQLPPAITSLSGYIWLVPAVILIHGCYLALNYWNTRTGHFSRLSIARVISSVSTASLTLSAAIAGTPTARALITASIAGQFIALSVLAIQILRDDRHLLFNSIRWKSMRAAAHEYRSFPLFSTWAGFLNTASWQLPVLLLGFYFTPAIVGAYSLGFRILQAPMSLIGNALSQVFLRAAAEAKNTGGLTTLVDRLFERLVTVGLFPILMLTLIGSDLYTVVFGSNWAEAGVYTQILSVWALMWFVSSPLSSLFGVLNMQERGLKLQAMIFSSRLLALGVGGYIGNARLCIALFAASGILGYGYLLYSIARSVDLPFRTMLTHIWMNILRAAPFLVAVAISSLLIQNRPVFIVVSFFAIILYGLTYRSSLTSLRRKCTAI